MTKAGYTVPTGAGVALVAGVAKTVIGVKGHANFGLDLIKVRYGFDGIVASERAVLIQLCYASWASNSPGTASTSITPVQGYGRTITPGFTAGRDWTTEPTNLTVLEEETLTPNAGVLWYDFPLGTTYDSNVLEGFVLRMTAPAVVNNVRASLLVERC